MELINTTCAAASLDVTTIEGVEGKKRARVMAKLTFDVAHDGRLSLVSADPMPLLPADLETPVGVLPSDASAYGHHGTEVIVNGAAYAPGGQPVPEMNVSLTIGSDVHEAVVTGDRVWVGRGADATPSDPIPFTRMPLTYERAFGGTSEVWFDEHTAVPLPYVANPRGRGFDPEPMALATAREWNAPAGFPRFDPARSLPNLEGVHERVARWEDAPRPWCWSTRPSDVLGPVLLPELDADATQAADPEALQALPDEASVALAMRCHPSLVQTGALAGKPITLRGMTPDGVMGFYAPAGGVVIDYEIDGRHGTQPLRLRRLVILPEERWIALSYELTFRFAFEVDGQRSARVRIVDR